MTGFEEGRPLFVRSPESKFNLANFMRNNLYTCLGAMRVGLNILIDKEHVQSRPSSGTWWSLQDQRCRSADPCRCSKCAGICYGNSR